MNYNADTTVLVLGQIVYQAYEKAHIGLVDCKNLIYVEKDFHAYENNTCDNKILIRHLPEIADGETSIFGDLDQYVELSPILHLVDPNNLIYVISSIDSEEQMKLTARVMNFLKDNKYQALCLFENKLREGLDDSYNGFLKTMISKGCLLLQLPEKERSSESISKTLWHLNSVINAPGLINLDFQDIELMTEKGLSKICYGVGHGKKRGLDSICQILEQVKDSKGASRCLVNIISDGGFGIFEMNEAVEKLREFIDDDAQMVFGAQVVEEYVETTHIMIIFSYA